MLELPANLQAIAERELNETPERRTSAMAELRQLLSGRNAPQLHRTDDAFLLMYLRHAKFDAKRALSRLKALARWMHANAELLGDWTQYSIEDFRHLYSLGFMRTLEGQSRDGAMVIMLLPLRLKPGDIKDLGVLLRWTLWTLHRAVQEPHLQVSGYLVIETFQGMSMVHAINLGLASMTEAMPQHIIKHVSFMTQCAPFRIQGIWVFHQTSAMRLLMAIARPFMSKKMKQRIRLFGADFSALHEQVDPAQLPVEFGGSSVDEGWGWFDAMKEKEAKDPWPQQAKEAKEA